MRDVVAAQFERRALTTCPTRRAIDVVAQRVAALLLSSRRCAMFACAHVMIFTPAWRARQCVKRRASVLRLRCRVTPRCSIDMMIRSFFYHTTRFCQRRYSRLRYVVTLRLSLIFSFRAAMRYFRCYAMMLRFSPSYATRCLQRRLHAAAIRCAMESDAISATYYAPCWLTIYYDMMPLRLSCHAKAHALI